MYAFRDSQEPHSIVKVCLQGGHELYDIAKGCLQGATNNYMTLSKYVFGVLRNSMILPQYAFRNNQELHDFVQVYPWGNMGLHGIAAVSLQGQPGTT